jgi:methanogenic corrinoid protein MtbC1
LPDVLEIEFLETRLARYRKLVKRCDHYWHRVAKVFCNHKGGKGMSEELAMAIVELKRDEALDAVKSRAGKGEDPLQILEECRQGMTIVGDRFQKGEYFLAELMLSAEIFKGVTAILDPHLAKRRPPEPVGKMVLATLKGDIHDLGKNIFATLLKAQGAHHHCLRRNEGSHGDACGGWPEESTQAHGWRRRDDSCGQRVHWG